MGLMEQAAAKLAAKYGTVQEGKYKGFEIAFGNDPSKPVEAGKKFEQIIFLESTDEKGRHNMKEDIKLFVITAESAEGVTVIIKWNDDEESVALLPVKKEDSFVGGLLKSFIKKQPTDEAGKNKEKYGRIADFFELTLTQCSPNTIKWYLDFIEKYQLKPQEYIDKLREIFASVLK